MAGRLSIIVVEPDRDRAIMVVDSLKEAGDNDIQIISEDSSLPRRIRERAPDVIIVDLTSPTWDMIEELTLAAGPMDRPVAKFVDKSDDGMTKAAIEAGVSAYVVDGLRPDRLHPVISAAITRFNMFRRMRDELAETKRALEERKMIDRAKGLLMKARGIDEDEAYAILRKSAMDRGKKISDVAAALVTAAHMLSPVPVAMALGIGGVSSSISALVVLSMNGNVIGVSQKLFQALEKLGHDFSLRDAQAAGKAIVAASDGRMRIGVPFPFSMHAELLYYWLSASGLPAPQGVEIKTVPPPLMADALAAGEIDAFCVGEPWGSKSVEAGVGALLLPCSEVWSAAPEKVLTVRTEWAQAEPDLTSRLMRAVWQAACWLGTGGAKTTASEVLARPEYLDLEPHIIDRSLMGRLTINQRGDARTCPG